MALCSCRFSHRSSSGWRSRCPSKYAVALAVLLAAGAHRGAAHGNGAAERATPPDDAASGALLTPGAIVVDLNDMTRSGHGYVAAVEGGGRAELTLEPELQESAEEVLRTYRIPFGAAAVVSVADGRVLALAGRSERDPSLGPAELALRPWAPAASVFKVVTAAALVEGGASASTRVCYHGGVSAVLADNLVDLPKLDRRCDTLAWGVGKSQNAIIAKLASRRLTPDALARTAAAFGFNAPLDFDAPTEPSTVDVPTDELEFARTAAGFYHSSLSVLHGALVAAAVANRGQMPAPKLVARAVDAHGRPLPLPRRHARRVLAPEVAAEVGRMMTLTTRTGTAKGAFRDRRGRPLLPVEVAGKTGTLSFRGGTGDPALPVVTSEQDGGYLGYSWFVGYAPADRPRIAFAVLIGNQAAWRIKATFLARRLVAEQLALDGTRRGPRMLASR